MLPGWLFLIAGVVLIGMAMLTPAWLDCGQLRHHRRVLEQGVDGWQRVEQRCRQFHDAIEADDVVVIEGLAFDHLRYKPAGATVLTVRPGSEPGFDEPAVTMHDTQPADVAYRGLEPPIKLPATMEARWVWAEPELYFEPQRPLFSRSRMVRLTSGKAQVVVIALGLVCLVSGFLWSTPSAARRGLVEGRSG